MMTNLPTTMPQTTSSLSKMEKSPLTTPAAWNRPPVPATLSIKMISPKLSSPIDSCHRFVRKMRCPQRWSTQPPSKTNSNKSSNKCPNTRPNQDTPPQGARGVKGVRELPPKVDPKLGAACRKPQSSRSTSTKQWLLWISLPIFCCQTINKIVLYRW